MTIDVRTLYEAHGPLVLRRCRRLLHDEAAARDAMHDVFVEILRRQDTLDGRSPAGLLLTTATHVCLNRMRSSRRHAEDPLLDGLAQATDATEERTLARRLLDRFLGRLSPTTRLILVLRHVDNLTLDEIAREVGMSVSGVRKCLRRTRISPRAAAPLLPTSAAA